MPDELHVLTGSYALDALTAQEREDFERHLHRCPSCDAEVRGLRETAARLAMAKTVRPPARMQERVLAATYRTRQLPPPAVERVGRAHGRARVSRLFARPSSAVSSSLDHRASRDHRPRSDQRPDRDHRRPQLSRLPRLLRLPRLVGAVAAASLVVAVGLGITQIATQHQLDSAQARNAAITKVVEAPDAHLETMQTSVGGTATVVFSDQQRAAVITTKGMASLPPGRVYQTWVLSSAGARSAGLLSQTDQTNQVLASGVQPGDRIGITVEPSGGTSTPTTTPVVVMPA
jgi:anti-sigma-K factor RskA